MTIRKSAAEKAGEPGAFLDFRATLPLLIQKEKSVIVGQRSGEMEAFAATKSFGGTELLLTDQMCAIRCHGMR